MNQKTKSTILIIVAALGLALTVRLYPKPEQTDSPKESTHVVETVVETVSESETETSN